MCAHYVARINSQFVLLETIGLVTIYTILLSTVLFIQQRNT